MSNAKHKDYEMARTTPWYSPKRGTYVTRHNRRHLRLEYIYDAADRTMCRYNVYVDDKLVDSRTNLEVAKTSAIRYAEGRGNTSRRLRQMHPQRQHELDLPNVVMGPTNSTAPKLVADEPEPVAVEPDNVVRIDTGPGYEGEFTVTVVATSKVGMSASNRRAVDKAIQTLREYGFEVTAEAQVKGTITF